MKILLVVPDDLKKANSENGDEEEPDLITLLNRLHRNIISARLDRLKKKSKPD